MKWKKFKAYQKNVPNAKKSNHFQNFIKTKTLKMATTVTAKYAGNITITIAIKAKVIAELYILFKWANFHITK